MELTTSAKFDDLINVIKKENGGEKALEVCHIMAYFAPEQEVIPGMFSNLFINLDEWNAAAKLLQKYSLVQSLPESAVRIKKEIQTKVQKHLKYFKLDKSVLKVAIRVVSEAMNSFKPNYLCHAMSIISFAKDYSELLEDLSYLARNIVITLNVLKKNSEAYLFGRKALDSMRNTLGKHHPNLIELEFHMGISLIRENRYHEALDLLLSLYEKQSEANGERIINHTLFTLTEVMMAIESSSSLSPSIEARVRRIVFGRLTVNKTKDNSVLQKWILYALLLFDFNGTTKAFEILNNVIKRRKEILNPNDDDICEAMLVLSCSFFKTDQFPKAMVLLENIYDKRKKNLGEMNEKTIETKFEMGVVLEAQKEYTAALSLFEEVSDKSKHSLGETHSLYLRARSKVALTCMKLGEYRKAYEVCKALYPQQVKVLGEKHKETFECKRNIGNILLRQNKIKEALQTFEELYEECKEVYGHSDNAVIELAVKIHQIQQLEKSEKLKPKTIHSLSSTGDLEKVTSLIETGVEVNGKDSDGRTPLHCAAQFGHVEIAKLLLEKGAKYNTSNDAGNTPLQVTETHSVRKLLLAIKGLFDSAKSGNGEEILQHISVESWIVNIVDKDGCTALHWASVGGHCSVVKLLLEFGADATLVSDKGNSSLHLAASKGHREIAELLLQSVGGDKVHDFINGKTQTGGNTPLHVAAERGFLDVVKTLLSSGAVYSKQNKCGKTPLDVAKEVNCLNLLNLVERLFQDAEQGNADIICKLLDIDSSEVFVVSKIRNSEKLTVLQVVTYGKHTNLARKLLKVLNYNDKS